jgi:phenylacetate-CoA ligase
MSEWKKYWNEEIETMPLDELERLQSAKLRELVACAYYNTVLYRRKFDLAGIKPDDVTSLNDLSKLPLTTYLEDFCGTPITERLAVPIEEAKIVSSTSGSLSGFTQPDLMTAREWTDYIEMDVRGRWSIGVRPDDVAQVLTGFSCCELGYQRLGATTLLGHSGRRNLDHQIKLANVMGVTVLEHLPSLVLRYFKRASELGIDIRHSRLRLVSGIGEGWAEAYKKKIEIEYGCSFRTFYGLVEALGAVECEHGGGMHIFGDMCIYEVIDPETKRVLGPGKEGELVITPLYKEATPLIRYRTGDIGSILPYQHCPCGRTHPKLSMVRGRVAQIIKVAGKRILPMDVEEVVANISELGDEYQIIVDAPGELPRLRVRLEHAREVKNMSALKSRVENEFNRVLGVVCEIELVPLGTIERVIFKAQRIIKTVS